MIADTGAKNGAGMADDLRGDQPGDRRRERRLQDRARGVAQPLRAGPRGQPRALGGLLDQGLRALGERPGRLGHALDASRRRPASGTQLAGLAVARSTRGHAARLPRRRLQVLARARGTQLSSSSEREICVSTLGWGLDPGCAAQVASGGAETQGEPTLPCLVRGASRLPVPSLPSRIVTIGLVCASLYAAALGAGAFAQDEEATPAATAAATETATPQAPAETSTATPTPFPSPGRDGRRGHARRRRRPRRPTADPTSEPTAAPTEAPTQAPAPTETATPGGKADPTATPGLGVDKTQPRAKQAATSRTARRAPPASARRRQARRHRRQGLNLNLWSRVRPGRQGSTRIRRTPTVRSATTPPPRRSSPNGVPTPANPNYSLATPGPATIGVPNFFIEKFRIPPFLLPIYQAAGIQYGIRWEVLAAINEIETDYGRNLNISSAGALGWMQFMPPTWDAYGVDANGDGQKDPFNPVDAIFAAARYLRAAGADKDLYRAIFAYNHADWYVESVLMRARVIGGLPSDLVGSLTGLTQGRFPVQAKATYAGALPDERAPQALHARHRTPPTSSSPTARAARSASSAARARRSSPSTTAASRASAAPASSAATSSCRTPTATRTCTPASRASRRLTRSRRSARPASATSRCPRPTSTPEARRVAARRKADLAPPAASAARARSRPRRSAAPRPRSASPRPAPRCPRRCRPRSACSPTRPARTPRPPAAASSSALGVETARCFTLDGRPPRPQGLRRQAAQEGRARDRRDRSSAASARRAPRSPRTCASRSARPAAARRGSTRSRSSTAGSCSSRRRSTAPRSATRSSAPTPRRPRSARSC